MVRRDKVIDNGTYSILLPNVREALKLSTRVSVMIIPLLGGIASLRGVFQKGGTPGALPGSEGLQKFMGLMGQVDPDKLDEILNDAMKAAHLSYNEKPISGEVAFEQHFAAKRGDLYIVLFWTLWECVKDFFPIPEELLQSGKAMAAKAFQSQMDGMRTTGLDDQSGSNSVPGET